jgi:uncharacterized membrane protein
MRVAFLITLMALVFACKNTDNKATSTTENAVEAVKSPTTVVEIQQDSTRCFGTEPFWDVKIVEKEGTIVYHNLGDEITVSFPYNPPKMDGEKTIYTTNDGKNTLTATLIKGKCSDGMSDNEHGYSSEVVFNNTKLKGCGNR